MDTTNNLSPKINEHIQKLNYLVDHTNNHSNNSNKIPELQKLKSQHPKNHTL